MCLCVGIEAAENTCHFVGIVHMRISMALSLDGGD